MRILAIESSCDDTSIALIEGDPKKMPLGFTVHAHVTSSQKIHAEFGGVYPAKAKEAHVAAIIPNIRQALHTVAVAHPAPYDEPLKVDLPVFFEHESKLIPDIAELFREFPIPPIDAVAVTYGPGLEPCLWVGVNVARALALQWNIPLLPINHMEGHALSASMRISAKARERELQPLQYPALALLISGGHTQLVHIPSPLVYKIIGTTRDDAVGEAYDKVARMMDLPYPGGPALAALADEYRAAFMNRDSKLKNMFPRPMLHSGDYDFSFSGLKTAVLYHIQNMHRAALSTIDKQQLAYSFESAVSEVLAEKTRRAIQQYQVNALLLGGGVANNRHLRRKFTHVTNDEHIDLLLPEPEVTTDNALMIAIAAFYRISLWSVEECSAHPDTVKAKGDLKI